MTGPPKRKVRARLASRDSAPLTFNPHNCENEHNARPPRDASSRASVWRSAFSAGAVDALRCAARRLPPETWSELAQLADEYGQAADG